MHFLDSHAVYPERGRHGGMHGGMESRVLLIAYVHGRAVCSLATSHWATAALSLQACGQWRACRTRPGTDRSVRLHPPRISTASVSPSPISPTTRSLRAAQSGEVYTVVSIFSDIINFKQPNCYYCDAYRTPERRARETLLPPAPPDRILHGVETMEFALLEICSTSPVFRRPSLVVVMTRHAETLALLIAIFETTRKKQRRKYGAPFLPASDSPWELCVHLRAKTIPQLTAKVKRRRRPNCAEPHRRRVFERRSCHVFGGLREGPTLSQGPAIGRFRKYTHQC